MPIPIQFHLLAGVSLQKSGWRPVNYLDACETANKFEATKFFPGYLLFTLATAAELFTVPEHLHPSYSYNVFYMYLTGTTHINQHFCKYARLSQLASFQLFQRFKFSLFMSRTRNLDFSSMTHSFKTTGI